MLFMTWFGSAIAAALCCGSQSGASESGSQIRARLLATHIETEVAVELRNGQKWKGTLTDITESHFLLLAEPDKETRKRLRLPSGVKLKKNLSFDDVVELEGAVGAELVEKYLILESKEAPRMQALLTAAAAAGFRVRAAAGRRVVLLERVESGGPFEYVPENVSEDSEKTLNELGAQGFRVAPRTIGSWVGKPGAILERTPDDPGPRQYKVLAASREGTLENEFLEAVRQGYRVVGLTKPDQRVVLLESQVPSAGAPTAPVDYRLIYDLESAKLSRQVEEGYRLVACSDGERICVLERADSGKEAYGFLAAARLSTFETELNELGGSGYRLHPNALGRDSEAFAVMVDTRSSTAFEYRVISRHRAYELQEEVALLAREGFEVAAMTSDTKGLVAPGAGGLVGGALGAADKEMMADAIVVMERSTSK